MAGWREIAVTILGFLSLAQTTLIYRTNRKEKQKQAEQADCDKHVADCKALHEKSETATLELRDRVGKVETRLDNSDKEISQNREFQAQLVSRIDEIHRTMLTKDDLKMLVEFIKRDA